MMTASPLKKQLYSIGDVIQILSKEFPELSISKIRFLESEGLINPFRAPSGYRKFTNSDLNRIQYILELQNQHYLPLRVIKEHLEQIDSGEAEYISVKKSDPVAEKLHSRNSLENQLAKQLSTSAFLSREELVSICRISNETLDELIESGLVVLKKGKIRSSQIDVIKASLRLQSLGVPIKHLRTIKLAADREHNLAATITKPIRERKAKQSAQLADDTILDLLNEFTELRAALLAVLIKDDLS